MHTNTSDTEAVLNAFPHPTVAVSPDYRIVHINRSGLQAAALSESEPLPESPCYQILHNRNQICPFCPSMDIFSGDGGITGNQAERIIQKRSPQGQERSFKVSFIYINSERIFLTEIIEDITEQQEKQEESLRRENLAALGTMISGIAHELNNPLTGMGLTLQNLEANLSTMNPDEISRRLAMIRKDLSRASRIVNDILYFAKPGELRLTPADLTEIISRARYTIMRLYPILSRQVEWHIHSEESVILPLNPEKMERLFINLFRNSVQAMDYSPGYIRVEVKKSKRWVHIFIEDNAGGIPEDQLKKIFNPFYSNSKTGKGSGLGLTICHSIVKEHKGRIRAYSDISSHTTTFHISLNLGIRTEYGIR